MTRVVPSLTPLNRHFWTGGANGELLILRCSTCDRWVHPPVPTCPVCGGHNLRPQPTSGRGTVFTYTVSRHAFDPSVPPPVLIAIVELAEQEGLRFTTNIVNCDPADLRVGMAVHVEFEQHAEVWVPVFTPD